MAAPTEGDTAERVSACSLDEFESRAELARRLGLSKGRVSQVLNDPGNLKLKTAVEFARVLNRKIAIVGYDDRDPGNQNGPINGQVFASCWIDNGRPVDMFEFSRCPTAATSDDRLQFDLRPSFANRGSSSAEEMFPMLSSIGQFKTVAIATNTQGRQV